MTLQTYINPDDSIDFNDAFNSVQSIPVAVYIPRYSDSRGIYLTRTNDFKYLKEYHLMDEFESIVLESFNTSSKSIGVLYLGLKGSGKTKRAHKLALDSGMPILYLQDLNIINKPGWKDVISTDVFNNFVIFIDEYEKKLEEETTIALLEWLDGSINNKQLFILIGNEKANNKFSNPLIDRLSRILWRKTFESLKEEDIRILVNKLSNRKDKEELISVICNIPVLSLDNTLQIINTTNLFSTYNVDMIVNMLNINFKAFDDFILSTANNQKVLDYDEVVCINVTKNSITFNKPNLYFCFGYLFVKELTQVNTDIDASESVYMMGSYQDLNVKFININRLSITGHYKYVSLSTQKEVMSTEPMTLYLTKDIQFYKQIVDSRTLVF